MSLRRRKANNPPIPWSEKEERNLLTVLQTGEYDINKLSKLLPNRTVAGIRSKIRKLRIKHDLFGNSYRSEKENFTLKVASVAQPDAVFDAYAGAGHQTFKWITVADKVYASEKIQSKLEQFENTAYNNGFIKVETADCLWKLYRKESKQVYLYLGDALDAAADIKVNRVKIDLIDLDTCGSTLPLLSTLLILTKPLHLVITHGEYHSMRFKREDVLRRLLSHRDVSQNPFPLNVDQMAVELDKAVKMSALRAHNETVDSYWVELIDETWLGSRMHGMLRRYYKISKPVATSDCINSISTSNAQRK
ncbi:MAG: hypothetical protein ACNS60_19825 [Candidatus Cyclobacteriaceae bacterium M2_1C_046]